MINIWTKLINEKYLKHIIKQYIDSRGIQVSQIDKKEFIKYLRTLINQTAKYKKYLDYLGIEIDTPRTIELDKGFFDSVALKNTLIVSEFASTLGLTDNKLLIENDEVIIHSSNGMVERPFIGTLITHNPYSPINIPIFNLVAQTSKIAIGIYGNIYDEDRFSKMKEIKELSKKIDEQLDIEVDTDGDEYFVVASNKINGLKKSLTRGM